ncbi:MAG: molybdopterin-dependent oxidoreductase [Caulobacteraceae bacterium]|nr:molybdopterin-dependent oxidoreductase [Caulobacteraceae bacterium]
MIRAALIAAALFLAPATALAQSLAVIGLDGRETRLQPSALQALSQAEAKLGDGDKAVAYQGPTLSAVLREAGVPNGARLHGKILATYVVVTGSDGYRAVLSLAEIDGSFRDGAVVLADRRTTGPLAENEGPYRLVVGPDRRPERAVRMVVKIEVVAAP